MTGADSPVVVERRGLIHVIEINRPAARNAIDHRTGDLLLAAVRELDADSQAVAGVLTGRGEGFSAGMDLKSYVARGFPESFGTLLVRGSRKPMIAAVEGFALAGGLEIALTCDLIVASHGSVFGLPEVSVGLFAAGGGLFRLRQRIPHGVATEMALTGTPITAEQAFGYGLVNHLVPTGETLSRAIDLASAIARNSPLATQATKQILREAAGRTEPEFWAVQKPWLERLATSPDAQEGPRAFAEKRSPQWATPQPAQR